MVVVIADFVSLYPKVFHALALRQMQKEIHVFASLGMRIDSQFVHSRYNLLFT